jgi:hypothetical protein
MYSEDDLKAELADIDRKLESTSAWLTPKFRNGLLAARDVIERVLERRHAPWPAMTRIVETAAD